MTGKQKDREPTSVLKAIIDLVGCTAGIYFCYIVYGVLQERIYSIGTAGEKFNYSLFLVFVQCGVNGLLAAFLLLFSKQPVDKTSHFEYFKVSFSYIGAMFSSNYALNFVNYPTQALGKSCKLIPVMAMNVIINKKSYKLREYINVALITIGISVFMLLKTSKGKDAAGNSWIGLALLFASLVLDGFVGPNQEKIIKHHKISQSQLQTWLNVWAVVIVFPALILTDGLFPALAFCKKYPEVIVEVIAFSVASAVGQAFIMITLFRFNSLILTTITTTRKFFTILASVVWFGHTLNMWQWLGVVFVFSGLGFDIVDKYHGKKADHAAHVKLQADKDSANGHEAAVEMIAGKQPHIKLS